MRVALPLLVLPALMLFQSPLLAVDRAWIKAGGIGDWSNGTNWSPTGSPQSGDRLFIIPVIQQTVTSFYDDTTDKLYNAITIEESGQGTAILQQTANHLRSFGLTIGGSGGRSIYDLSGGSANFLGVTLGSGGTLLLGGTATLSAGAYVQNDGVATIDSTSSISGSDYTMSGGTWAGFSTLDLSGTFTRTGGTFSGPVVCGTFNQSSGSFDGDLTVLNNLNVTSSFTFNGRTESHAPYTLPVGRTFSFATSFDQVGSMFAQTGTVQNVGSQSTFVECGIGGNATWDQTAGSHSTGILFVGSEFGSGTYLISGNSTLAATGLVLGYLGDGTFIQTGGNVTIAGGALYSRGIAPNPGPHTAYQFISGGTFTHSNSILVGMRNAVWGQFIQTGGMVHARGLTVNVDSTSSGTVDISGGTFLIDEVAVNNGVLRVSAGRAEVTLDLDGAGDVIVGGSGSLTTARIRQLSLSLDDNGSVIVTHPAFISRDPLNNEGATTSRLRSLTFGQAGGAVHGSLDLGNNKLAIDYPAGQSPAGSIRTYLASGFAGGSWTGTGIRSNNAARSNGRGGLGWAEASDVLGQSGGVFGDLGVDPSTLLIKLTYYGDANLDGQVDVSDLGRLATNWQSSADWSGGDFNYDGFVDVSDLGRLATNWQAGVGHPLGPGSFEAAMAEVGLSLASVPEPAMAAMMFVLFGAVVLCRRRGSQGTGADFD